MEIKKPLKMLRGWFPQEPQLPKSIKIKLESQKRDWFPKEPLIAALKSTDDEKFNRWALCPFLTPGALMIVSSLLSALFGFLIVGIWLLNILASGYSVAYILSFHLTGILSVSAFLLGMLSGILLLANRSIAKAVASIVVILSFGVSIIAIPILLDAESWESNLPVGLQMVGLSTTALISVGLNYRKLKNSLITKEANVTHALAQEPQP